MVEGISSDVLQLIGFGFLAFVVVVVIPGFGIRLFSEHIPALKAHKQNSERLKAQVEVLCNQIGTCEGQGADGSDAECMVVHGKHHVEQVQKVLRAAQADLNDDSLVTEAINVDDAGAIADGGDPLYQRMLTNPPVAGSQNNAWDAESKLPGVDGDAPAVVACYDKAHAFAKPVRLDHEKVKKASEDKTISNPLLANGSGTLKDLQGLLVS